MASMREKPSPYVQASNHRGRVTSPQCERLVKLRYSVSNRIVRGLSQRSSSCGSARPVACPAPAHEIEHPDGRDEARGDERRKLVELQDRDGRIRERRQARDAHEQQAEAEPQRAWEGHADEDGGGPVPPVSWTRL
jgi:hypothetical protein